MTAATQPAAIRGVLFDLHCTLVDQGSAEEWLERAWQRAYGELPSPGPQTDDLLARLHHVWETARVIDPESIRDLDAQRHREVFDQVLAGDVDITVHNALYEVMLDLWHPYDDTAPVLAALRRRGIRVAIVSNVGIDIRPVLDRGGLTPLVDAVVMSYEVGVVKPDRRIFQRALDAIGVAPAEALMVGDAWRDDAGAAALGIRTLILPRTDGPVHGLEMVLRLLD